MFRNCQPTTHLQASRPSFTGGPIASCDEQTQDRDVKALYQHTFKRDVRLALRQVAAAPQPAVVFIVISDKGGRVHPLHPSVNVFFLLCLTPFEARSVGDVEDRIQEAYVPTPISDPEMTHVFDFTAVSQHRCIVTASVAAFFRNAYLSSARATKQLKIAAEHAHPHTGYD
ncbi:hypothetical protein C8Q76DRAFT_802764 [Earliella scabrosa]|nr:hypothetical protein C8Q76DRAFT_802764 [Earliella scabrosa]